MKLRIRNNFIRLRLTQSEVDTICSEGLVMAHASFPDGAVLDYVLDVQDWASTEQVSIEAEETLDKGDRLKILIEKDFACLAPREGEDESDMYSNPLAVKNKEK